MRRALALAAALAAIAASARAADATLDADPARAPEAFAGRIAVDLDARPLAEVLDLIATKAPSLRIVVRRADGRMETLSEASADDGSPLRGLKPVSGKGEMTVRQLLDSATAAAGAAWVQAADGTIVVSAAAPAAPAAPAQR